MLHTAPLFQYPSVFPATPYDARGWEPFGAAGVIGAWWGENDVGFAIPILSRGPPIAADEMGLGKTFQTIALLATHRPRAHWILLWIVSPSVRILESHFWFVGTPPEAQPIMRYRFVAFVFSIWLVTFWAITGLSFIFFVFCEIISSFFYFASPPYCSQFIYFSVTSPRIVHIFLFPVFVLVFVFILCVGGACHCHISRRREASVGHPGPAPHPFANCEPINRYFAEYKSQNNKYKFHVFV